MLQRIADGRTDLVFEAPYTPELMQHCLYYGDVSAIRYLLSQGATLDGEGLNGPAFHGHWQLCQFLLERGADPNQAQSDSGETPLHAALCKAGSLAHHRVIQVLLAHGADPNVKTNDNVETGGFMRDCRTKGETPLHRAAAFASEGTIQLLLDAGAVVDARDARGETPLSWASWYLRGASVLRLLCYGPHRIRPNYAGMEANLLGVVHRPDS